MDMKLLGAISVEEEVWKRCMRKTDVYVTCTVYNRLQRSQCNVNVCRLQPEKVSAG